MPYPCSRKSKRSIPFLGRSRSKQNTRNKNTNINGSPSDPVKVSVDANAIIGTGKPLRCPCKGNNDAKTRTKKNSNRNGYLPKTRTMTARTAATAASSKSAHSSTTSATTSTSTSTSSMMNHMNMHQQPQDLCPVTGVYAEISDDYQIYPAVIGKGHYGIVRECVHRNDSRQSRLAVKSIDKSKIGRLDHLRREIFILASVGGGNDGDGGHEGVMKMLDCYEDGECIHIVTERYTGGELFSKIMENTSSDGCFSERKAARVIESLLQAVAYLHDNGVVHRDIKPENILFESSTDTYDEQNDASYSSIKLIDFGLSRRHDPKRDAPMNNPVGTAYYMSPELLKGRYDRSCDIWSVGVVAYILLSGYPPFNGSCDEEIQESTRRRSLRFAGHGWVDKSDGAMDFVKCLLTRDPRRRFTAREALMHPWIRKMSSL